MGAWDQAEGWMSGMIGEIASLMRPLVNPIVEKWDSITGDPEAVHQTADKWRDMADSLRQVGTRERDSARETEGDWMGDAALAFRAAAADLAEQIDDIAAQMDEVGGFLDEAAEEVRYAEELIGDLIRELIEWAIISLAVSAATAVITLGASAAAGAAAAASKAAITAGKVANILRKVASVLGKVRDALKAYKAFLKGLSFKKRFAFKAAVEKPIVRFVTGLDGDYKTPAVGLGNVHVNYGNPVPDLPGVPGAGTSSGSP